MAIALDSHQGAANASPSTTLESASATVAAGADRYMVGFVASGAGVPSDPSAFRWGGSGGTAMTKEGATVTGSPNGNTKLSRYHLDDPAVQSSTLHATYGGSDDERAFGAAWFTGVSGLRTSPTPVTGTGNAPSITATTVADDVVVAAVWGLDIHGTSMTVSSAGGQTSLVNATFEGGTPFSFEVFAMDYKVATGTSTQLSWTFAGADAMEDFIVMAFVLTPAAAAGDPALKFMINRLRPRVFAPGRAR